MKRFFLIAVLFLLSGCITTSSYHKAGAWPFDKSGYSSSKVSDGVFRVRFDGNEGYSLQEARDYALLRCAEITLENGDAYFAITKKRAEDVVSAYTINNQSQGYLASSPNRANKKPLAIYDIQCSTGVPKGVDGTVYNAAEVKMEVKDKYRIK